MHATHLVTVIAILCHLAQNVKLEVFDADFERKLDLFVQETMECRRVPGLTLAVVKDDELWSKGYGHADISTSRPVFNTTLFNIGSVTKHFTMTLLGILLTERNMTWNTKVQDILGPDYQFEDEYRTKEMTLKDMLSHRTGLARLDIGLMSGFPDGVTRESLTKQMKYLPEFKPFRDSFIYNNYMFMYLGHICEVLGGDTWETLLYSRLLGPVGMASTKILKTPADVQTDNVAKPYIFKDGKFQNGSRNLYNLFPIEPAGAILSSGEDMLVWMKFLLNNGKLNNGTKLVDEQLLKAAFKVTTPIDDDSFLRKEYMTHPTWPIELTPLGYGHALFLSTYRGYRSVWHSGGLFSYITRMAIYPDSKTGVFLSTNGPGFKSFASNAVESIFYYASDGALGLEPWLNDTTTCTYPKPWLSDEDNPAPTNFTSHVIVDPDVYTGVYENVLLPTINITVNTENSETLKFTSGRLSGLLLSTEDNHSFKMEVLHPWELKTSFTDQNNETLKVDVTFNADGNDVMNMMIGYEVNVTYIAQHSDKDNSRNGAVSIVTSAMNFFQTCLSIYLLSLSISYM